MALKINGRSAPGGISPFGLTPPVSPGREFGRISGPLLSDNLLRNGVNLAFDTDAMYLNVNNKFVGVNTNTPTRTLDVFGEIVDSYTMTESVKDEITVRLVYEGRAAKVVLKSSKVKLVEYKSILFLLFSKLWNFETLQL